MRKTILRRRAVATAGMLLIVFSCTDVPQTAPGLTSDSASEIRAGTVSPQSARSTPAAATLPAPISADATHRTAERVAAPERPQQIGMVTVSFLAPDGRRGAVVYSIGEKVPSRGAVTFPAHGRMHTSEVVWKKERYGYRAIVDVTSLPASTSYRTDARTRALASAMLGAEVDQRVGMLSAEAPFSLLHSAITSSGAVFRPGGSLLPMQQPNCDNVGGTAASWFETYVGVLASPFSPPMPADMPTWTATQEMMTCFMNMTGDRIQDLNAGFEQMWNLAKSYYRITGFSAFMTAYGTWNTLYQHGNGAAAWFRAWTGAGGNCRLYFSAATCERMVEAAYSGGQF